jgi:hypothetical protein
MAPLKRLSLLAQPLNPQPGTRIDTNCFSYLVYWGSGLEVEITLIGGAPDLHAPRRITGNGAIYYKSFHRFVGRKFHDNYA